MRFARFLALLALAAFLVVGCGSDDEPETTPAPAAGNAPAGAAVENCRKTTVAGASQLHVTNVECQLGRNIVASWTKTKACSAGSSHPACTIRGYRCIASRTDAGLSVNCSRPNRSISFLAKSD